MSEGAGRRELIGAYAKLIGIERAIPDRTNVDAALVRNYNDIVRSLIDVLPGETIVDFTVSLTAIKRDALGDEYCFPMVLRSKLYQVLEYLRAVHGIDTDVVRLGTLYSAIQDEQLKLRCSDLLSSTHSFDRVLREATTVLEDRLRRKTGASENLTGAQLVNTLVKSELRGSPLRLADNDQEQKGLADILRGVMHAFRNPTHHQISSGFSREDALKVCAFIDSLVRIIDQGRVMADPES